LLSMFSHTLNRGAFPARPAPNDFMELGNHADFLGVMPSNEMLARFFINDTMNFGGYRLKKPAEAEFWRWLTSWAVCMSRPADLGQEYHIENYELPPLVIHDHALDMNEAAFARANSQGMLFPELKASATRMYAVKRESIDDRIAEAVKIASTFAPDEHFVLWCETNDEADALIRAFPDAVDVRGEHSTEVKERRLTAFSNGEVRAIITKAKIAGFGLNWQHCHKMIDVSVTFSFEKLYQKIRRSWRFGQEQSVDVYMIYSEAENNIRDVLREKQVAFREMQVAMNEAMREHGLFRDYGRLDLIGSHGNIAMTIPEWLFTQSEEIQ